MKPFDSTVLACGALASICIALGSTTSYAATEASRAPLRTRLIAEIPRQSLGTYAYVATEIAHVRVVASTPDAGALGMPRTRVAIDVLGTLKGTMSGRTTIDVAGIDGPESNFIVPQAPRFRPKEEVLLFLSKEPTSGTIGILGLDQGTYRIVRDAEGISRVQGLHGQGDRLDVFLHRTMEEWARAEADQSRRRNQQGVK